ncbi:hypothetical protein V8E54_005320 [Elaphomyces granulatus]
MSNEEFIGREPGFVGAAVQTSIIGKWISDTGSANTAVGNLDKKPLTPKPTSAPTPLIMSNTIPFGFQVDEKPQREQCLIEDTQKSQHSNLLVETDEDGHENLLQEQEPCDEETLPREPSSEIPSQPPEAPQSLPTQVSQRPNKGILPERHIRDEQATWENKARNHKGGMESVEDPMQEVTILDEPRKGWQVHIPGNYRQAMKVSSLCSQNGKLRSMETA